MMTDLLNPHLLTYEDLTCSHGHSLHTSKAGRCTCGWVVWSTLGRAEIEKLHDTHLQFVKTQAEQARAYKMYQDVNRHTLRFRGPNAAQCDWCNWQVTNMEPSAIHEAFSRHKERIRKEAEGNG